MSKTVPDRSERTVTGAVDREPSSVRTSKFATGLRKFPNAREEKVEEIKRIINLLIRFLINCSRALMIAF